VLGGTDPTNRHEPEVNLENSSARYPAQAASASSEVAYDRLTGYGFARRYVAGKTVADIGWEEIGRGSRLLAESAESVTGLISYPEAAELASAVYPSSNVSYRSVDLSELPYAEGHFDVVAAFGVVENLEHPENFVTEIKRVLTADGVLIISALDKQANTNYRGGVSGGRGMYVLEFRELLERHFGRVHLYRQGAVAGGIVFPASEGVTAAPVESIRFSLRSPSVTAEPPTTRSVVAVCSDAEAIGQEERPYLLLDSDRRVFYECEERAEDVELLRGEIQRMQETEVQAFRDALKLHRSTAYVINRYITHLRALIRAMERRMVRAIKRRGVREAVRIVLRRLVGPRGRAGAENSDSD
jgi:SAM-dependent methyltransferase